MITAEQLATWKADESCAPPSRTRLLIAEVERLADLDDAAAGWGIALAEYQERTERAEARLALLEKVAESARWTVAAFAELRIYDSHLRAALAALDGAA